MEQAETVVNGRVYPLWSQFVNRQKEWAGGSLIENGASTEIVAIKLSPNGESSAYFEIEGKEFSCGFDVRFGGISGKAARNGLTFAWLDNTFSITKPAAPGDPEYLIGKRVRKTRQDGREPKPFKSGLKVNTVASIIKHPQLGVPACTFEEDDSYVACYGVQLAD